MYTSKVGWQIGQLAVEWDLSSAGRASALQAEGHRFEPYRSHFLVNFLYGREAEDLRETVSGITISLL